MFSHSPGGAFKGAAQMGQFAHTHASQMATVAAARRNIAQTLGSIRTLSHPPGAPVAPQQLPAQSGLAATQPPPLGGNFKAVVAHHVTQATGKPVSLNAVHGAIHRLVQKGTFSPFQGQALQAHNGPLVGPNGMQTMQRVAQEVAGA